MDIVAFIDSGLLGDYCMGFCTPEEKAEVEQLAGKYPLVKTEIERLNQYFEEQLIAKAVKPAASVKIAVMKSVYKQQAALDNSFVPLIDKAILTPELHKWVSGHNIQRPDQDFEDTYITPLPSTEQVTNFIVAAKTGHEPEVHNDFIEYLFVIKGSCTMNVNGCESSYVSGDIITILPHLPHFAVVTSAQPMLALVQRQLCA